MTERIIIAGAGGQGIMLLGKVVAEAAMRENRYTTWLPAYGAEVRGGTAYCMNIISDEEIGSPYIEQADTLIAMNALATKKFKDRLKRNGLFIINSSFADGNTYLHRRALKYPFSDMASGLGNTKVANMIALGCYLGEKKILNSSTVHKVIEDFAPADKKELIEINIRALTSGIGLRR